MRWLSGRPSGADFGAVGDPRKGTEHQTEDLAVVGLDVKSGEGIHTEDGADFLEQELPRDGSGNREVACESQLGITLCFFRVVGERPEIVARHDFAAEQIGPDFGVLAKILNDESLWGGERFVVNDQFCGTATKRLEATEKIASEGFGFLSTVEPITSDEQQHPDAGDHFVDEDLEGEVCERVRRFVGKERMQA